MTKPRCVNLDWFEVHVFEPCGQPHSADYFRSFGHEVIERDYGTRVYREMFTVRIDGRDFIEVRRNPASQGYNGLHAAEESHLRLVNAACYLDDAIHRLRHFLDTHHYTFSRITRADICLDFERFDRGDDPAAFIRRYFEGKYAKINQANISSHGTDTWCGQVWHSLAWGSTTSDIGTKMYNKTLELYDRAANSYRKPHIRYAWFVCGLIDDFHNVTRNKPDGSTYTPQIYRVEFSIRSSVKRWFLINRDGNARDKQSIRNTLDMYDSRDKLLVLFASLAQHYFHFKHVEFTSDGNRQRKDRCRDKDLFIFNSLDYTYKIDKQPAAALLASKPAQPSKLDSLLRRLRLFRATLTQDQLQQACSTLIRYLEGEVLRSDLNNPWSTAELLALQQALSIRQADQSQTVTVLLHEIKSFLHLNNQTAPF